MTRLRLYLVLAVLLALGSAVPVAAHDEGHDDTAERYKQFGEPGEHLPASVANAGLNPPGSMLSNQSPP